MPDTGEERIRLVAQELEEKLTLSILEQTDQGGNVKQFWSLTRETPPGEKPLLVGGTMAELGQAKNLFDRVERFIPRQQVQEQTSGVEREVTQPRWFAVVRFERTQEDGAAAQVVKTFPDHERTRADEFVASTESKRSGFVLLPQAFDERPKDKDIIFVPQGMSTETNRRIDELRWQETNGKHYTIGVWYERESGPREGQLVTVGSGREPIRGDAELRKIIPFGRPIDPGDSVNPVFVVVERNEKVFGRGRIVAVHHEQSKAVEHAKGLEQGHQIREQVNGPEWNKLTLSP
jgi:hypothetical protein